VRALALAVWAALPALATANPVGPEVVSGQASFQQAGNTLTVTNSPGAILHWQSFSIAEGELTRFVQQSAASSVLNRIVGQDPSLILGSLQSNGQVFLINPNGIVFGPNAQVDVAGLVASSLNVSNPDFLAGRLSFSAELEAGAIRNDGAIRTLGSGNIYLIAPSVENHGIIQAPDGAVVLAAGSRATLVDTHRPDVRVEIAAPEHQAVNVGSLIGGHIGIYGGAIRQEGVVSATQALVGDGGTIVLRASSHVLTGSASRTEADGPRAGGDIFISGATVSQAGRVSASGGEGGRIRVEAEQRFTQTGTLAASGTSGGGGAISVTAAGGITQTVGATIDARGASGGSIALSALQGRAFLSGTAEASGSAKGGGTVSILARDIALVGSQVSASGSTGGGIILVGGGPAGDRGGATATSVYASQSTTLRASATRQGRGGDIILWSEDVTRAGATLVARGGTLGGDGGFIEVSGKSRTAFGGIADAGASAGRAGTFLLDPKNILIDDTAAGISYRELLDPNPNTDAQNGNGWGQIIELQSGNTLVTDPYDNAAGTRSGAIYVYRGSDGALLTALTGAAAEDGVGIGHRIDVGSNLLLVHTLFGSGNGEIANAKGAVTWLDPVTGRLSDGTTGGVVSAANSLLGERTGDRLLLTVNNGLANPLATGSSGYFLLSENWNEQRGAITWIDVGTGRLGTGATGGVVSAANSVVGASAGDRVGYGRYEGYPYYTYRPIAYALGQGWLFFSPYFGSGGELENARGAVTWLNAADGKFADGSYGGVLGAANSLVGNAAGDRVGGTSSGEANYLASNGNALIRSPDFAEGAGALSWIAGTTGRLADGSLGAVVSATNSFIGGSAGDGVASLSPTTVTNGYLFRMPEWNAARGALLWIDMGTGRTPGGIQAGVVGAANSIVGGAAGDRVGDDVRRLASGHYLVLAPDWDSAAGAQDVGSVTWIRNTGVLANGATSGTLSAATSLTGGAAFDRVGSGGIVELSGNNALRPFVVLSPSWGGGGVDGDARGAVTWMNGVNGNTLAGTPGGVLSAANSLVGSLAGDRIGTRFDAGIGGGTTVTGFGQHLVVASPYWNNGRGAVTFISGSGNTAAGTAALGAVSNANSLIGERPGGHVGQIVDTLSNGHVVVRSPEWWTSDGDSTDVLGAVTWMNGTTGLTAGLTSASQFTGIATEVGPHNSLTGALDGDRVGSGGLFNNGSTLLVLSPSATTFTNNGGVTGAVTWMDRNTGRLSHMTTAADYAQIGGVIQSTNSLFGAVSPDVSALGSGAVLLLDRTWEDGRGALTWMSGTGRLANGASGGIVSEELSVLGSASGEGASLSLLGLSGGNQLLLTPDWSDGGTLDGAGAVTWISASTGRLANGLTGGVIGQSNSIVGGAAGDRIGSGGITQSGYYYGGHLYFVRSPEWTDGGTKTEAGALTRFNANTGLLSGMSNATDFLESGGTVSSANSLLGAQSGDRIGDAEFTRVDPYFDFNSAFRLLIRHANVAGGAGAITWMRASDGALIDDGYGGYVTSENSLVGSAAGDALGSAGIQAVNSSETGRFFVLTPEWSDGGTKSQAGAVTWIDGRTGTLSNGDRGGVVSAANSLVGSAAGDRLGSGGMQKASYDYEETRHFVFTPHWSDGGTRPDTGAVTWIEGDTGRLIDDSAGGVVSAGNSLVGAAAGDAVGSGGLVVLNVGGGRGLILSPDWSAGAGAVTWVDAANGRLASGTELRGVVSQRNSLVGTAAGDRVGDSTYGFAYYHLLDNSSDWSLIFTPDWSDGGTKGGAGAITWIDPATGLLGGMTAASDYDTMGGAISSTNSLLGARAGDRIGGRMWDDYQNTQYFQPEYRYVGDGALLLLSRQFAGGAGAVTWVDTRTALLSNGATGGVVGTANSVVGDRPGDGVGSDILVAGNYALLRSPDWHDGAGAVTAVHQTTGRLVNGATGGIISAANSVVGSAAGDRIGQNALTSGSRVLFYSSSWGAERGAVTWLDADTGLLAGMTSADDFNGTVGAANSLVGERSRQPNTEDTGDRVGGSRVFQSGSYFVVMSEDWNDGRGAVTRIDVADGSLFDGAKAGVITAANSLVGSSAGDGVGSRPYPQFLNGGNLLFATPEFGGGRGAVTLMPSDWSLVGELNDRNSVIGSRENAGLQTNGSFYGTSFPQDGANGTSLIRFATDGTGRIVVLSNTFTTGAEPPLDFADFAGQDITVAPSVIERMLNSGTRVTLQASNDITIRKAIRAVGTSSGDGSLTLQAGRSVLVNADVVNGNVDADGLSIRMVAHESAAAGVIAAQRDAGAGEIRMAAGTTISGTGTVRLEVGTGAGVGSAGGIHLANVTGGRVEIVNAVSQGTDPQRVVEQLLGSTVRQSGAGTPGSNGVLVEAGGAIFGATTALIAAESGNVILTGRSVGAPAAPMRLAVNGLVTTTALAGGAFLEQPEGSAASGSYAVIVPDDQPLSLSVPNGVLTVSEALDRAGSVSFTGGSGLVVNTSVRSGGNIVLATTRGGVTLTDASVVSTGGSVSISGESLSMTGSTVTSTGGISLAVSGAVNIVQSTLSASGVLALGSAANPLGSLSLAGGSSQSRIGGQSGTDLRVRGDVTVAGGAGRFVDEGSTREGGAAQIGGSGVCSGFIGGDLVLIGGSADGATATLFGSPDVGAAGSPLQIGGVVRMTTGSGANAYAAVIAGSVETIYLGFPNRDSGGFTVDDQAVVNAGSSGFFAGGREAILGQNLIITYGSGLRPAVGESAFVDLLGALNRGLALPEWAAKAVFDDDQPLPQCR